MSVEVANARILVVGLGASGVAAARLLHRRGARVIANDAREIDALSPDAQALADLGIRLVTGGHDEALFRGVDRIVVSPGVPPLPALEAAERAGVPIASEIELASWFIESVFVGITGTNGKSTVTSLVGEMCRRTGRPTFVGGNLGTPLIDVVDTPAAQPGGYAVVELSSFQLERVDRLHVHHAALLNVTEDHLDRYPTFEAYCAAKSNVFHNQEASDSAVIPDGDSLCRRLAAGTRAAIHTFGGDAGAVRVEAGELVDAVSGLRLAVDALPLRGRHNLDNACAAALLARLAGVDRAHVVEALESFSGLPHRMALVRCIDDVEFYDDSKATNVGAAVAALDGLSGRDGRVVLIAGGKDKGGDYGPLVARMAARGRAAILIGEAADRIASALQSSGIAIERATDMAAAVGLAHAAAHPGDAVLLAPACSSFDMFRSYAHRGEVFVEAVRALKGGGACA